MLRGCHGNQVDLVQWGCHGNQVDLVQWGCHGNQVDLVQWGCHHHLIETIDQLTINAHTLSLLSPNSHSNRSTYLQLKLKYALCSLKYILIIKANF